ncbi:hypothetical protein TNCV_2118481 [Trichonephila clavipes]|nr:hypothetical protein TNCV_2118481 [Trichonephila clavipes]
MRCQYDYDQCKVPLYVYHETVKHGCDNIDAIKRIWIYLKKWHFTISVARFIVDRTIEDASVCGAASREQQPWSPSR